MRKNKSQEINPFDSLDKFPGGTIVSKGLRDISTGNFRSIEALSVFTASPRLNWLGFSLNENFFPFPHLLLYEKLKKKYSENGYAQYNALMSRVAKFCNHYEGRKNKLQRRKPLND
ncbi:MAG: hypothetical protein ABI723_19005 [Bacteroidia bacterium]